MKFLIVSVYGSGAGLAWKIQEEGHEAFLFIKKPFCRTVLKGIVPHVNSIEEGAAKKPDLIIFDTSQQGKEADALRKRGFRVIGAGAFNDLLELDRTYGMSLAKKVGIKVPEFTHFEKGQIQQAIEFIDQSDKRYVLKCDGDSSLDLTYVSKGPEDMIHELEWIERQGILKEGFMLQEFMDGWELSTEMWFSNGNPIPSLANSTIERKKFMTGDIGPNTGCEASIVWPYGTDHTKIIDKTLSKMYPILKEMKYSGPIDINTIISKQDGQPYFLEWTPRLGYSAIYAFLELLDIGVGDFFYRVAVGKTDDLILRGNIVSMALTLSIPPYPLDQDEKSHQPALVETKGKPVEGVPSKCAVPADVYFDGQQVVTAGTDGLVTYVTSSGQSVEEAEDKCYEAAESVQVANMQHRIDGGQKAMEYIPELKELGYDGPYCRRDEADPPKEEMEQEPIGVGDEDED